MEDYEKKFEEDWKDLLCNEDGTLNKDKVMRELHDYSVLLEHVPKVYMHITGGKISKPNTLAGAVIAEADDSYSNEEVVEDPIANCLMRILRYCGFNVDKLKDGFRQVFKIEINEGVCQLFYSDDDKKYWARPKK
jgi:hypothetical protein